MNRIAPIVAFSTTLILLAGCNKASSEQPVETETTTSAETQPHAWILTSAPEGAVSILEAKANAAEGDQIVIKGRIGGRHSPVSADSPVFTIVDLELVYCGQHSDEGCVTPWDYCCEKPETIASNSATVQIVGFDSIDPLAAGLEPLDEVVIIGTVGQRPDDVVLTIQATGVYPSDG